MTHLTQEKSFLLLTMASDTPVITSYYVLSSAYNGAYGVRLVQLYSQILQCA